MVKVKFVIFDFAGTLATLNPSRELILHSLLRKLGLEGISIAEIRKAYDVVDSSMFFSSVTERGDKNYRQDFYGRYNQAVLNRLQISNRVKLTDVAEAFQLVESHWVLVDDAFSCLNILEAANIGVGILSNFGPELPDLISELIGDKIRFAPIVVSSSVGLEKPDLAFFNHFLSKIPFCAEECAFIGDSFYLDYVPGNKIGFQTYLVNRELNTDCTPETHSSLIDIVKIITN